MDETEDIFATSESDPSPSDGDRESDEDFIADDEEPTSALEPREQLRIDREVYAKSYALDNGEISRGPIFGKAERPRKGGKEKRFLRTLHRQLDNEGNLQFPKRSDILRFLLIPSH